MDTITVTIRIERATSGLWQVRECLEWENTERINPFQTTNLEEIWKIAYRATNYWTRYWERNGINVDPTLLFCGRPVDR